MTTKNNQSKPDPIDKGKSYKCSKCEFVRPEEEFIPRKDSSTGRRHICKSCDLRVYRDWYQRNKEKKLKQCKEYYQNNKEKVVARQDPYKNRARKAVNNAVKDGRFEKKDCEHCFNPLSEFHHTQGYDELNWFVGMWLCRACHSKEHVRLREEVRYAR